MSEEKYWFEAELKGTHITFHSKNHEEFINAFNELRAIIMRSNHDEEEDDE